MPGKMIQATSFARYKTITKCLYANLPLVQQHHHRRRTYLRVCIDPGADVNVMPAAVYKQLTGDTGLKNLGPVQCTMRVDKLQVLRESTKQDETLVLLKEIVTQGWPEKIKDLPPELQPYWTFQEAITVADGLLLKGNHIIIPDKDRPQILKQIHEGHLGIQKCL